MESNTVAIPVSQNERIILLDSLRGFAILGILLMNIPSMSLPGPVAHDPSLLNEYGSINYYLWYTVETLFNGTQRALFSMLFGAGVFLFTSRLEKRIPGVESADYFIRRQLWLMVFSITDVFLLLWNGDILLDYACIGIVVFVFRKLSPKKLIICAAVCLLFMTIRENRDFYSDKKIIQRGEAAALIDTSVIKLSVKQQEAVDAMKQFKNKTSVDGRKKRMQEAIENNTGSYEDLYEFRSNRYLNQLVQYLYFEIWDVLIFMFLGMAFFKMGVLTGNADIKLYWLLFLAGMGIGVVLSYFRMQPLIAAQFNWYDYAKTTSFVFFQIDRVARSLGLFGLLMLLYKSGWFKWLFAVLRPVGQMAFTNYLMQSVFAVFLFYGIGLGLYGQLERYQVYLTLAAIWVVQIIYSHIWLRHFLYGPFEWAWRSLTYWKKQPFRKK
ncbi:MAG: DUF418 domain-containing protein [Lacibacter sp.]